MRTAGGLRNELNAEAPVIAVDGPGGTGKGTLCSRISRWLDWHLLDSGALYRILALLAQRENIALSDAVGVAGLARGLSVQFVAGDGDEATKVLLEGADVGDEIRREDCGGAASNLAGHAEVREAILGWQRGFRRLPGLVADGRDMGTVVFPAAELKVFLTASPQERAKRRYNQLKVKGNDVSFQKIMEEIAARDNRDSRRALSPLRSAEDAIVIDTSASGIEDVFVRVAKLIKKRFGLSTGINL